jgi:hypothetical protein
MSSKKYTDLNEAMTVVKTLKAQGKIASVVPNDDEMSYSVKIIKEEKGTLDIKDLGRQLEADGYVLATKEQIEEQTRKVAQQLINEQLLSQRDAVYRRHMDTTIEVADESFTDFLKAIRTAPKVKIFVTVMRNNKGESTEYKKPVLDKEGNPVRISGSKQALMMNYIPITMNGQKWEINIAPETGPNGIQSVGLDLPLPLAYRIANSRNIPFIDPTNQKWFYPIQMRMRKHEMQVINNQFQQSNYMQEIQGSFRAA